MKNPKYLLLLFLLLSVVLAQAQEKGPRVVRIETFPIKAEVVGVLEGRSELAVIKILRVDSTNNIGLKPGEEVLVEFHFGTKPVKNEPEMAGVSGGETISAQISGRHNPATQLYDYRIFQYAVLSKLIEIETSKSEKEK